MKAVLFVCVCVLMAFCTSAEDTIEISNSVAFVEFAVRVENGEPQLHAVLKKDIVLSSSDFKIPVGAGNKNKKCISYEGEFDGGGHTISGISLETTGNPSFSSAALFCDLKGAYIHDLIIDETCSFTGSDAASISVTATNVTLRNIINKATVNGKHYVGGLISSISSSQANDIKILNTTNQGNVIGNGYSGGFVGSIENNERPSIYIQESNNYGDCSNSVQSGNSFSAGFIGFVSNNEQLTLRIEESKNNGNIRINAESAGVLVFTAGFISYIQDSNRIGMDIKNSVNNGIIEAHSKDSYAGGIIGVIINDNNNGIITLNNNTNNGPIKVKNNCYCIGGIIGLIRNNLGTNITAIDNTNNALLEQRDGSATIGGIIGLIKEHKASSIIIYHGINEGSIVVDGEGTITRAGGVIGFIHNCDDVFITTKNCHNSGTINGTEREGDGTIGGIVGEVNNSKGFITIDHNVNDGSFSLEQRGNVAGIIGLVKNGEVDVTLKNCENKGSINAPSCRGLVGVDDDDLTHANVTVLNSINKGNITGTTAYGIADRVNKAHSVVSLGTVKGSLITSTFWDNYLESSLNLFYTNNCYGSAGDTIHFDKESDFYTVEDNYNFKRLDLFLNDLSVSQGYEYGWDESLEFTDQMVSVHFGSPVNRTFVTSSGGSLALEFDYHKDIMKHHWFSCQEWSECGNEEEFNESTTT